MVVRTEYHRNYRKKNREKILKQQKEYHNNPKNKEKAKAYQKNYQKENYQDHKEKKKLYLKEYNQRPESIARRKEWQKEHYQKPEVKKRRRDWWRSPKGRIYYKKYQNKYQRVYQSNRKKTDLNYNLLCNLRLRINQVLKGKSKSAKTKELLGCPIDYFLDYMESQFDDEMSWANYGQWHLDHIKPCAAFDLINPEEQRQCFHYTNMQPLWAEDNLRKGATEV